MDLAKVFDQVYYDLTLNELRMMNRTDACPDISHNSMLYLHLIHYKEDCTVSYLAEALHITKPAVTAKVNELQRLGLVEKVQSEKDRRVFFLRSSVSIKADYRMYDEIFEEALERVRRQYSDAQAEVFCQMLLTFSEEYNKIRHE